MMKFKSFNTLVISTFFTWTTQVFYCLVFNFTSIVRHIVIVFAIPSTKPSIFSIRCKVFFAPFTFQIHGCRSRTRTRLILINSQASSPGRVHSIIRAWHYAVSIPLFLSHNTEVYSTCVKDGAIHFTFSWPEQVPVLGSGICMFQQVAIGWSMNDEDSWMNGERWRIRTAVDFVNEVTAHPLQPLRQSLMFGSCRCLPQLSKKGKNLFYLVFYVVLIWCSLWDFDPHPPSFW